MYFGHFQSLRLTWQKTLNIDASQRAFATAGRMHVVMAETYNTRLGDPLQPRDHADFSKKICTLKVKKKNVFFFLSVNPPLLFHRFHTRGKSIRLK